MARSFLEFVEEKQNENKSKGVVSKTSLGDGNDFPPLVISDDPNSEHYGSNSSLAPIVRAFKKGGNWGWSKDQKSGEDKPVKISGKKLYLAGGAVRDHLAGKKPRNMELVTNASPDEIYHILKQNDFDFNGDEDGDKVQSFWVLEKDTKGRPFKFGIRVKNDEFELSVFTGNAKGIAGEFKAGTQEDDAAGRDFTINALFIALTNDNGPNKELVDFYGGLHHLRSGKIASIGDMEGKLKEDPKRALRYARMLSRYGKPETVENKEKELIGKTNLSSLNRKDVVDEFMKSIDYEDGDPKKTIQIYGDLGLLGSIFPNMTLNQEFPKELSEMGDKHMPIAWLLHKQAPEDVEKGLDGFDQKLIKKIMLLIKSLHLGENIDPERLDTLRKSYYNCNVSPKLLKNWTTKIGKKDSRIVDAFIQHINSPRVKVYISEDSGQVHDAFKDLVSTDTALDMHKVNDRKRMLEFDNFREILKKHIPKRG